MQLKSRLVFLHAHQKVYRLRNISVAYWLKELGAALPHQSGVRIPTPFPVYDCQRLTDSSHIFILQWVKQLKQKPKSKVGKTRKSPRVPEIPVCYIESSESNGRSNVKSPKAKGKATGKSPRAAVKAPQQATGKSPRAAVKSPQQATRKSPRAAVKSPKQATRKSPRVTAKPVCQVICILPITPFFQGILHLLYNPLIKLLVAVVTVGSRCILCRLPHRGLWQVRWSCACWNCWRATAMTR